MGLPILKINVMIKTWNAWNSTSASDMRAEELTEKDEMLNISLNSFSNI